MELVKRNYWWLGLKKDIKRYIQGCFKYQQNKVQYQKKSEELHPLNIPQGLWQEISIDVIRPLSKSNEIDAIVVIVDRFMKMIRLKATTVKIVDGGLYFISSFHFYFILLYFSFSFSIFRTAQVRGYQSRCHISHNLMAQSQD